ncbi:MAG: zinc-dependent alcohol dehydrogenase [Bryobacteraceae bacterium]
MSRVVWLGGDQFQFDRETALPPRPAGNEVVVRVRSVGICGTDIHILKGSFPLSKPPLVLGHEMAGEILAAGPDVTRVRQGDRVTVDQVIGCGQCAYCKRGSAQFCETGFELGITRDGGCQDFVLVPETNVYRVPDSISFDEAAVLDMEVFAALSKATVRPGEIVLVVGAGSAGLIAVQLAAALGASKVLVAEKRPGRLRKAREIATSSTVLYSEDEHFYSRLREETNGLGPDLVIDCAGTPESANLSLESVTPGGRVVLFGVHESLVAQFDINRIVLKDIIVYGALSDRRGWEEVIELASKGQLRLEPLITHRFPMSRAPEAYELVRAEDDGVVKAVLTLP